MSEPAAPRRRLRLPATGPLLWVLAILCVAYLPIFLGQILFYRDPAHWNYPARWFVRESIWRGEWPLWNPQEGLGFSVLANPLYGLFYPPNWLFLITPRALVANMLAWQGFAHVAWGSAGMMLLVRRFGVGALGQGVAGIAWGLSGYTTASWTAGLLLFSGAWLPWCGVGFVDLVRRAPGDKADWLGAVMRGALPLAMALLLGELFAAVISAGFGLAMGLVAMNLDRRARPRRATRVVAAGLVAVILAGGLAAAVILPARTLAAATDRARPLARAVAEACSLHPLRLIELAAPGSMGYAYGDYVAAPWIGDKLLDGRPLMFTVYTGASVLALAWLALGRGRRAGVLIAGLTLFTLLLSFGRFTPVHAIVRTVVRPLAYMRYPEKYMVAFAALIAALAGMGADRVLGGLPRDGGRRPWRRTLIWLMLLATLAGVAPSAFPAVWVPFVVWGAIKGALAASLVLVVQLLVDRLPASGVRLATLLLVLGVSADLAIAAWPHLDFGPAQVATRPPAAATAIVADARARGALAPPRVYRAERTEVTVGLHSPARDQAEGEAHSLMTLIPNAAITFGVATVPGYDAAIPSLLPELWIAGQKVGQSVLRLLGIGYAILPIDNPSDPIEHRRGLQPMLDPLPGARLYRVPAPLPRVYLAGRAEAVSDAQAMARLFEPDVVDGNLALVTTNAAELAGPPGRAGACSLTAFSNNALSARCQVDRPGLAVFLEQHDLGWGATVDGAPAPLLRANLLMRAVPLSPGTHVIRLVYTPPGLRMGLAISLFSLLALAVMLLTQRRFAGARRRS